MADEFLSLEMLVLRDTRERIEQCVVGLGAVIEIPEIVYTIANEENA